MALGGRTDMTSLDDADRRLVARRRGDVSRSSRSTPRRQIELPMDLIGRHANQLLGHRTALVSVALQRAKQLLTAGVFHRSRVEPNDLQAGRRPPRHESGDSGQRPASWHNRDSYLDRYDICPVQ
jgi:hypothetical protein